MPKNFLPSKDADLLVWANNFSAKITATPVAYGLLAGQATAFAAILSSYSSALATSSNPVTRTRGTVAAKDAARTPMTASARNLARIINAFPTITNQQRIDLGLNPRTGQFTPINPPTETPVLEVVAAIGRLLKVKLHSINSDRRAKPDGVSGASIFSFVGAAAPADIALWRFEGSTTRTVVDVEFAPTVAAGSQVWLTAFWYSPRAQSGPACTPISAYIAGGVGVSQAA